VPGKQRHANRDAPECGARQTASRGKDREKEMTSANLSYVETRQAEIRL
jgi:hypothetical protein